MDWGEFGKKIIGKKMIVLLLVTGAVYFFLQYLTPLSAPVLLAMLFVTIFGPMMKRMNQRLHFPRPLSAIVLLIVATVLLVGLLWILVSWMLGSLPVWIGNLELREQEWLEAVRGLCRSVGEIIGVDTAYLENTVSGRLQEGLDSLEENILPGMLSQSMQYVQWFAELGGFLVEDGVPIDHPRGDEHPAHTGPGRRACDLHVLGDGHGTQGERQGARRRAVRRAGHHPVPAAVRQRERHIQVLYQVGICCWGMYRT